METVFVGLSGGVDSAVSAALLKERGYRVVGAFIKIWSPEFLECTWKEDRLDAMRVAAALDIPFREVDLSDAYKKEVVGRMIAEYERGITPNPDVLCNRSIKFGHFAQWALAEGADKIATGHYARIDRSKDEFRLLRGADSNKDQSYFLYRLAQEDLAQALFPIGEYEKPQVRSLARRFDLPNAERPDSQGLCFVGDVSMEEFLGRFLPLKKGEVLDEHGAVIGSHFGAALYTIGQRHGFRTADSTPRYVARIDVARNQIVVSPRREDAAVSSVALTDVHWIGEPLQLPCNVEAQARYRETPCAAVLERSQEGVVARFEKAHIAARGQSLVLYRGDRCVGGGDIV